VKRAANRGETASPGEAAIRQQYDLFGSQAPAPAVEVAAAPELLPVPAPAPTLKPSVPDADGDQARTPAELRPRVYSVSELTAVLKNTVESRFPRVLVRGELSNFRRHTSGHLYFALKDAGSRISGVMFRSDAARVPFAVKDGIAVVARGRISVYEPRGEYELICDSLEPEGAGARALALEALKAKLLAEGIFAESRKRPLPFIARRIGVATSKRGAALQDFLRVVHERFPVPVLVADCRVQGEGASSEIARAIGRLSRSGQVDVIVVTRGGGSSEDLWAFNEEIVVRAIATSVVPVISAVGHEVDVTLADFAADRRAATPTHAAKEAVPSKADLIARLQAFRPRLFSATRRVQLGHAKRLGLLQARVVHPGRRIAERRLRLDDLADRAVDHLRSKIASRRDAFARLTASLGEVHPRIRLAKSRGNLFALERTLRHLPLRTRALREHLQDLGNRLEALSPGRALVFKGGRFVSSIKELRVGDEVRVDNLEDGAFDATVNRVIPG
jgi:exodeoxyribonuclease VII large subunit